MNRSFISAFGGIIIMLCILTIPGFAREVEQDTMIKFYYKYPQKALQDADRFYAQGIKEQNGALLIKSLILKTAFHIRINKDSWPDKMKELEIFIENEKDVAVKSILNSYLAQLYYEFYSNNRYQIDERSLITHKIPADINEWSSNIFKEPFFSRIRSSICNPEQLQKIKTSDYDTILIKKGYTELLCPTLYDFLVNRAIRMMAGVNFPDKSELPAIANPTRWNLNQFLAEDIHTAPQDAYSNVFKLYQQWLSFRKKTNNPLGLLITELEWLEFTWAASTEADKDSCYLAALEEKRKEFASSPYVIEIMNNQARLFLSQAVSTSPQEEEMLKQKALKICEEGVRQYPTYNRINLLNRMIIILKEPEFNIHVERKVYPGKNIKLRVNRQNISSITVQINKVSAAYTYYRKNQKNNTTFPQKKLFQQVYPLSQTLVPKDTLIEIPIPTTGLYEIQIKASGMKGMSKDYFVCEPFSVMIDQFKNNTITFRVRDRMSGKPIKNANIILYNSGRNIINSKVIDTLTTDQNGFAETTKKCAGYQVCTKDVQAGEIFIIFSNNYTQKKVENEIKIITDRTVYLPGQTIFFKGYSWFFSTDRLYTKKNQTFNIIFKDNDYKVLKTQKVSTNEFGTFTGSFKIPAQGKYGKYSINLGYSKQNDIIVAEYKRPKFDIALSTGQERYHNGDQIVVKGKACSFSGINLQETTVNYSISRTFMYGFGNKEEIIPKGSVKTDKDGLFEVVFKTDVPKDKNSNRHNYLYKMVVTITDAKGETQESSILVPVLSGVHSIETEIPLQVNKNKKTGFYLYTKDNSGEEACNLEYSISKLVAPDSIIDKLIMSDTIIEKTILSGELHFVGKDSLFPALEKEPSGAYLFTVKNGDMVSKTIFYLYAVTDKCPPIPTYQWLVEEKTICKPGENAEILVGTSVQNAYLLYEIYSKDGLIKRECPILSNEILHLRIPFLESYGNGITIVVYYTKDEKNIKHVISVTRQREERQLILHTRVFRDKLKPGQQEQWEFCIKNAKGKNVKAEILAMMYDASLDKIENYSPKLNSHYLHIHHTYGGSYNIILYNTASFYFNDNNNYNYNPNLSDYPIYFFDRLKTYCYYSDIESILNTEYISQRVKRRIDEKRMLYEQKISEKRMQDAKEREDRGLPPPPPILSSAIKASRVPPPATLTRNDFSETAFFYPHLRSDSTGKVVVKFTAPESTTKWKFIAIAHTPDMKIGSITRYVTTSKEFMIAPNLPRFFRSGDQTVVKATVSNLSKSLQKGESVLELFVPATGKVVIRKAVPFEVATGQSVHIDFDFMVPTDMTIAGCRVVATGKEFSDGEQKLVPVLPDKTIVTATQPFFSTTKGNHSYTLPQLSTTRQDFRLTLELTANPIWYAVQALPGLTEPRHENVTEISAAYYVNTIAAAIARANPKITNAIQTWAVQKDEPTLKSKLERNSELKSILLNASPWAVQGVSETERMQSLYQLFDSNRLEYLQQQAINKLVEIQTPTGGWSWFEGMPASQFMTENVLAILAKANSMRKKDFSIQEKNMQIKALRYLDKDIQKDSTLTSINSEQLLYLYVRSMYRDIPLGDALPVHKYFMSKIEKQWDKFSFYEKAIAATTLFRYGRMAEVKNILKSLRQYAVTTPEMGMYWPENRNQYYQNDAVQVHTAIMEAFLTVEGNSQDIRNMKQWLLRQKQTQQWGSVPATVDAIYVLLLSGNDELAQQEKLTIQLGNKVIAAAGDAFLPGYVKESIPAAEIKPEMSTVKITKVTDSPTWGGLYLQYFEHLDRIKKTEGDLKVGKELFVEKTGEQGRVLSPLSNNTLHTGDKIVVRLMLSLNRDMQFLHLKDLRAACLEPVNQLSGNQWKFGTVYYQEVKDACTNLFFNALSRGTYVVEYPMWVNQTGVYQDGIATLQCVYAPEFSANSAATKIVVK